MNFPDDLLYTEEHEWLRLTDEKTADGRKIAIAGISDFAQGELGELVYIEVETIGETLSQNDVFGTIVAVKTSSDVLMPASGEGLAFNPELSESGGDYPALINSDPYGEGWIVKIALSDEAELDGLMKSAAYSDSVS
jgi:glycine cleavage system H protein